MQTFLTILCIARRTASVVLAHPCFYSGKKKRHSLKSQVVVDKKTQAVICTSFTNGKKHDFRRFKESKTHISHSIKVVTDTAYQGLSKIHPNSELPKLSKEDKRNNRKLSSERVINENVIGSLKRFKIIADRYQK